MTVAEKVMGITDGNARTLALLDNCIRQRVTQYPELWVIESIFVDGSRVWDRIYLYG